MNSDQQLESYLPVYDTVPETWEEGRQFLIEQLRKISEMVNIREIGWFLDEELLSGKQFLPGATNSQQFRSIFRKAIDVGPLIVGLNAGVSHGITFDANFTLIDIWVAGTNSATFTAKNISGNDVLMNSTQVIITSPQSFDRAWCFIEYIQEL